MWDEDEDEDVYVDVDVDENIYTLFLYSPPPSLHDLIHKLEGWMA
jgi:hypothetical protein